MHMKCEGRDDGELRVGDSSAALWLDCQAGIAGDMLVAALLDAAPDRAEAEAVVTAALESLHVEGFDIAVTRVVKAGLSCLDFNVILDEAHENHDHDMEYLHGHAHAAHGACEHALHEHEHEHEHEHAHAHAHAHEHIHRGLAEVEAIIAAARVTPRARTLASRAFGILAAAEAEAHGVAIDQVHFHEVGAVDSIADILAASVLIDHLGIGRAYVPVLVEGHGTVRCQHGVIPVPVPATLNICAAHGLPLAPCEVEGELVTPTGAALVAALDPVFDLPARYTVRAVGLGAGKRTYSRPSVLRAVLIEGERGSGLQASVNSEGVWTHAAELEAPTRIVKLECDIDDATPEQMAYAASELARAGAREVHWLPIFSKKGRPAYQLQVLCQPSEVPVLESIIFAEAPTLGIRRIECERTVLARERATVQTPFGPVTVKRATLPDGKKRVKPEYEDCAALARTCGVPLHEVVEAAILSAR